MEDLHYEKEHYTGEQRDFWDNGQLSVERNWVDGKIHGISRTYFQNGQLQDESHFEMGKLHGIVQSYHINGQLEHEGRYEHDVAVGIFHTYDKQGNLLWEFADFNPGQPKEGYWAKKYYPDGKIECKIEQTFVNGKPVIKRKVYSRFGFPLRWPF